MRRIISAFAMFAALMLSPTHSGAQTLFSDDFSSGGSSRWEEIDGVFSVANRKYRIESLSFFNDARAVAGDKNWDDYALEVDFFKDYPAPFGRRHAAILFRVEQIVSGCDAGRYFQVHCFPDSIGICRMNYSGGNCNVIATAPVTIPAQVWHKLRLEVFGSSAIVFLNNKKVLEVHGQIDFPRGRIGLKAINGNINEYANVSVVRLSVPGGFTPTGPGCIGSTATTPRLTHTGIPVLGGVFHLALTNCPPGVSTTLLIGTMNPCLYLGPFRAPGCQLHASPDVMIGANTDASGGWALPIRFFIPSDPALLNGVFYLQTVVSVPQANGLGLLFSNGHLGLIGK